MAPFCPCSHPLHHTRFLNRPFYPVFTPPPAQEKATVPRTIRRSFGEGKGSIPWIDYTTAMVNFYYFYCVDEDFGPFFLKFCSYFPYGGKLCINGHGA